MSHDEMYDAIIIGSGAAGGMAAYELCRAGVNVLMLEAGRDYESNTETPMFATPERAPLRAAATTDKPGGFYDATVDGGTVIPGEPYTVAEGSDEFQWWRPRMLGGRTTHWGRVALRYGEYDFKPHSRDGLGFDWPISYQDLEPSYDEVERLVGVTGRPERIENTPDPRPGIMLPPPPPRAHEVLLMRAFRSMGMKVAAIRAAVLTKPLRERAACLYATPCTRGCTIGAAFQSPRVLLSPAHATGHLTIRCNAVVYRIDIDEFGCASGVTFIDRTSGEHHAARARVVALAAGAFSSVRLLLNSKSSGFPDGIGNSSGLVGKYIMDTVEFTLSSRSPALERIPPQNDDGIFTPHIYVPWWLHREQAANELDFPRGYHIEPRGGRRMPTVAVGSYVDAESPMYGAQLHDEVRRKYGSFVFLSGEGEMIPNEQTFCQLDSETADKWGIPVLKFHWKWSDYEKRQVKHMFATFNEVFRRLGAAPVQAEPRMPEGGSAVHEVGGARMGISRENSVVDSYGRCWDVPNVFVMDGATFVSSADKNPTLTILAIAHRASARILELGRRGEL
jgi:choline dehydrogenase-like flavoprotein